MEMESLADQIRDFLHQHHLRLNTDLGQHFLIDDFVLTDIVDAADIAEDEHVVEIGPGIGVLTCELLARAKTVTAIELDDRLIPLLKEFTAHLVSDDHRLEIIEGNALQTPMPDTPYKVVANIPYHITSPLFRHLFLQSKTRPTSLTLLIQKEVAQTICSTKDAGILTIIVGLFGEAKYVTDVPSRSFLPPPQVESAVIHVESYPKPKADPETIERIFTLIKIGFGQKRKMLRNSIGALENGMERMEKAGIDPTRRPQTLSVEEWIALAGTA